MEDKEQMGQLASLLCEWMYREHVIGKEEIEVCRYGLQITMANMINFIIMLFVGILCGSVWEMGMFYVVFISLRLFCGGYHADSYGRCFLMFGMTCFLAAAASGMFPRFTDGLFFLYLASAVLLGVCILKKAPVEHVNRPISADEKHHFKRRGFLVCLCWFVVGIFLWYLQEKTYLTGIISAFIMVSVYMFTKEGGSSCEKERT